MQHPFATLEPDYASWVANAKVLPRVQHQVDAVAQRLVGFYRGGAYGRASMATGVPVVWMAASFEREASSNFHLSPAQGDPLDRVSTHVPRGLGPYTGPDAWDQAAIVAYHIDRLDQVGRGNWSLERACYEGEIFNGFGPRDAHHVRPSYVVAGTDLEQRGKYVADGVWDGDAWDEQLGILPIMQAMLRLAPDLQYQLTPGQVRDAAPVPASPPPQSPLATHALDVSPHGVRWVQAALNLAVPGAALRPDGSYGKLTRAAVFSFQRAHPPLDDDGVAGPLTLKALDELVGPEVHVDA